MWNKIKVYSILIGLLICFNINYVYGKIKILSETRKLIHINNGILDIKVIPEKGGRIFSLTLKNSKNIIHPVWGILSDHPAGSSGDIFSSFWSSFRDSEYDYYIYKKKNNLYIKLLLNKNTLPFKIIKIIKIFDNSSKIKVLEKYISNKDYDTEIGSALTGFLEIERNQKYPYIFYTPYKNGVKHLGGPKSDEEINMPFLCDVSIYNQIQYSLLKKPLIILYNPVEDLSFIVKADKMKIDEIASGVDLRSGYVSYEFHFYKKWKKDETVTNIYTIELQKGAPLSVIKNTLKNYKPIILSEDYIKKNFYSKKANLSLAGSFIQPWGDVLNWSLSQWQKELKAMKEIGMDLLIVQFAVWNNSAFYPSKFFRMEGDNYIEKVLKVAEKLGMNIYIGLATGNDWWNAEESKIYLQKEAIKNKRVAKEIFNLFHKYKSFKGWYIPHEISDSEFRSEKGIKKLAAFISDISSYCKKLTPDKVVSIAPYYSDSMSMKQFKKWWENFLSLANLDIVMLQDGVGVNGNKRLLKIPVIFETLKEACDKNNVQLWDDLEVFKQIHGWPYDSQPFKAVPADVNRIIKQIKTASPFVKKIVIYDFNDYMSPVLNKNGSAELYKNYKKYYRKWREK